jgi:hypothetical protein
MDSAQHRVQHRAQHRIQHCPEKRRKTPLKCCCFFGFFAVFLLRMAC